MSTDENWSVIATLYQGNRGVGGKLKVENQRLRFSPHAVDRHTGGLGLDVPLDQIAHVGGMTRSWKPASFAPRRRLRLRLNDGTEVVLLVNRVDRVIASIADSARSAGGDPITD